MNVRIERETDIKGGREGRKREGKKEGREGAELRCS